MESYYTPPANIQWYEDKRLAEYQAVPAIEADLLIARQEAALLQAAEATQTFNKQQPPDNDDEDDRGPLWTRKPKPKK